MTVHVCEWSLHDSTYVYGGYMTVHVSGGYMTVHVSGGYMTVHVMFM